MKNCGLKIGIIFFGIISCGFTEPQECDIFNRVVVTGASVSAGFGLKTPPIKGDLGAYPVTMKHIMEAVINSQHEDVHFYSDMMFFRNPSEFGSEFIEKIIEYEPTLVVGIDFLFWFGYGSTGLFEESQEYRIEKFESGLQLLSKIDAPIIVGDLPNMHRAIGKMLSEHQVPDAKPINKLNTRLKEWAKEHANVTVIPVHDLIESLLNDNEITVHESTWPAGSQSKLLQKDMLHTTLEGTVIASLMIVDALEVECVETDPKIILKKAAANARAEAKAKIN